MKNNIFIAMMMVSLSTLSCSIFIGGPAYPTTPIPVSTQAVQSLNDQVHQALAEGAQSGLVTLQISESQLTSYVASYLNSQPNPPILDPQIYLRNGQLQLFGQTQQGFLTADVSMTMQVSVDSNGLPQIMITQADFGPLPAPQQLNDALSTLVQQAFTGSLGPAATGFRLQSIDITDGMMTITGLVK